MKPSIFAAPALLTMLATPLQAQQPIYITCQITYTLTPNGQGVGARRQRYFRIVGNTVSEYGEEVWRQVCAGYVQCTASVNRDSVRINSTLSHSEWVTLLDRATGRFLSSGSSQRGEFVREEGECTPGENPETSARRF